MSIAPYHRMKCVGIICLRIVVYRNICLRIDIYVFVSKLISNALFFSLRNAETFGSHLLATEKDIQVREEDEEDDDRG